MLVTCPVVSVELAVLEIVEDFCQTMDTTGRPPTTQRDWLYQQCSWSGELDQQ